MQIFLIRPKNSFQLFPFSRFTVFGNSMLPTLKPGQDILCFNWAYLTTKPKKGDMVVIKHQGKEMIKRVQKTQQRGVFVMGDNQTESTDSRSFGPLDQENVIGKVIYVVR